MQSSTATEDLKPAWTYGQPPSHQLLSSRPVKPLPTGTPPYPTRPVGHCHATASRTATRHTPRTATFGIANKEQHHSAAHHITARCTHHLAPRGPRLHAEPQGAQPPAEPAAAVAPAAAAPAACCSTPASSSRQQPPQHLLHPPAPHRPRLVRPPRQVHPLQAPRPCSHTTPRRLPPVSTCPIRRRACSPDTRLCSPATSPRLLPPAAALRVTLV